MYIDDVWMPFQKLLRKTRTTIWPGYWQGSWMFMCVIPKSTSVGCVPEGTKNDGDEHRGRFAKLGSEIDRAIARAAIL